MLGQQHAHAGETHAERQQHQQRVILKLAGPAHQSFREPGGGSGGNQGVSQRQGSGDDEEIAPADVAFKFLPGQYANAGHQNYAEGDQGRYRRMQSVSEVGEPQQGGQHDDYTGSNLNAADWPDRHGSGFFDSLQPESGPVENVEDGSADDQVGIKGNAHQHKPVGPGEIAEQPGSNHRGYAAGQQRRGSESIQAAHGDHQRGVVAVAARDVPVGQHLLVNVHHDGAPGAG